MPFFVTGADVTVNSLHPGIIITELGRHAHITKPFPIWMTLLTFPLKGIIFKSIVQGAQTTIHCAVAEELEGVTGKYFR